MSDTKVKAKGTSKTEAIIGAASNKFVVARKGLQDAVAEALKLTETMDEQALKIADNEEKLNNLVSDYNNKRTQMEIDLGLDFKAGQAKFAQAYLVENGLVSVPQNEYSKLKHDYETLQNEFAAKVAAEAGKARGMAESAANNAKQIAEAEYKAKEAQNLAKIENLTAQLSFANQQAKQWESQLNAEREASVKRAQASSVGAINVTGAGK